MSKAGEGRDCERTAIARFLDVVGLAPRQASQRLTLWPLVLRNEPALGASPKYVALEDALAAGVATVAEATEVGIASSLRVDNHGEAAVLVLLGEELRGGLRDRGASASLLVGAGETVALPVCGLEEKRWSRRLAERLAHREARARLEASRNLLPSSLRCAMTRAARSAPRSGAAGPDPETLAAELRARLIRAGVRSRTRAYADYVHAHEPALGALCAAFHAVPDQVGFLAGLDGVPFGLELVGRPEVFVRVFEKLLRSYALDAIEPACPSEAAAVKAARRLATPAAFLKALAGVRVVRTASGGYGAALRIRAAGLCGAALVERQLVHLCAFAA